MLKKFRALSCENSCSSVDGVYSGVEEPGVNVLVWLHACSSQATYSSISNWSRMSTDKTRRDPVNLWTPREMAMQALSLQRAACASTMFCLKITESQNGSDWKGPLEITWHKLSCWEPRHNFLLVCPSFGGYHWFWLDTDSLIKY